MDKDKIPTRTELKAALYDLVDAAGNIDGENAQLRQAECILHDAIMVLDDLVTHGVDFQSAWQRHARRLQTP